MGFRFDEVSSSGGTHGQDRLGVQKTLEALDCLNPWWPDAVIRSSGTTPATVFTLGTDTRPQNSQTEGFQQMLAIGCVVQALWSLEK